MILFLRLFFVCLLFDALLVAGTYTHYRLPTAIKPDNYHLKIITHLDDPENFTFNGEVTIELDILEDTKNITFHAKNLTIDESQIDLKSQDGASHLCLEDIERVPEHDYFIMVLCEKLQSGSKYKLQLKFSGNLSEEIQGYFFTSYEDTDTNETKWLTATDFQPTYARLAFPCWDEPNYKAKFRIWLGHNKSLNALSNMPLDEQIPLQGLEDHYVWSKFQESIIMPTYLVAYSINDFFATKSEENIGETEFRVWSPKDKSVHCDDDAELSRKILKYFEEILQLPNPLKKIDQIAIPNYPNEGMENWGLVVYNENYLCIESYTEEDLFLRKYSFALIAHELAHQWFGKSVTTSWWTDTWLHEGFASYFSYLAIRELNSDINSETTLTLKFFEIFNFDAKLQTHPISQLVTNNSWIHENFDRLSYLKGFWILRMVHLVLGNERFFRAIQQYLKINQYQNVEQNDLFREFNHESKDIDLNMTTILKSWTLQTGYPVVKIWRNYENGSIEISQQRFLTEFTANAEEQDKCWWMPLSYTSASESDFTNVNITSWLECDDRMKSKPIRINCDAESNEWLIFNLQVTAFYRVMYDPRNWQLITTNLLSDQYSKVHVLNRAQLVGDAFALACAGHQEYDIAFGILEYLRHEYEYPPWKSAYAELELGACAATLKSLPKYRIYYNAFMRQILKPHLQNSFRHTDTDDVKSDALLFKSIISTWAKDVELGIDIQSDIQSFQQWRSVADPDVNNTISIYKRNRIYCKDIANGNESDWHFLWQRFEYNSNNNKEERRKILQALNCTAREFCMNHIEELVSSKIDVNFLFDQMASRIIFMQDINTHINFIENHRKYFENVDSKVLMIRENIFPKIQWIERNLEKIIEYLHMRLSRMGVKMTNEIN
ncbi:LOW QUALITY PROTEIN: aminopeptidase N-like [Musca vetustissima]|uniref:LOW QUALITY PROTEIN: aminopeptidase N-like n=1 Tax=Musca vetustissima TaxID=27455 RepID=UPI002AB753D6|nr:LOW QUALITY PROTEIN: aminopeptidase N-like [Musca vetustissima]